MAGKTQVGKNPDLPATVRRVSELGAIVAASRKRQGLTQADVSGLAGLGIRFLVDLEAGKETIQMQKALDVLAQLGLEVMITRKGGGE
ncbi:MAG: transcriptional regulator [Herminiimonas sp.]|nr:transcriptional regulator [Herminiimonas sp.]MDB5855566.1 transcriptional regulator [Herminiimonas sp.]